MLAGELEQHADDLVLHEAEPLGAKPAVPVLQQQALGGGAALDQRGLSRWAIASAQLALVAAYGVGQQLERGGDGRRIENRCRRDGWSSRSKHGAIEIAERRRCVTGRVRSAADSIAPGHPG